jgi:hydroxymethylpyrimidine/phosphomethylpyrimidine kinase
VSPDPLVVSAHALDAGFGEGFVADAGVFAELDCRAACVATSLLSHTPLPLELLARQLDAVEPMGPVAAVRIGFVSGDDQVTLCSSFSRRVAPQTTVVAPSVRVGTTPVLDVPTRDAMRRELFPIARVVVARAADCPFLAGLEVTDLDGLRNAAKRLRDFGARAAVVAGLLVRGRVLDLLDDDGEVALFDTARIQAPRVPGLAGAHAAALTAHLARGLPLSKAAEAAQRYIGFRLKRGR